MAINSQSIEVFLAIVKHGSISAAARVFHYSQPSVSEHLNQLEEKIGATLILRRKGNRQVVLTPTGKAFLPLAEEWMDHQRELEHRIERFIQNQNHNSLRLAASAGGHQHMVSNVIYKLMGYHPNLNLQLRSVERREIESAISAFFFDVAFHYGLTVGKEQVHDIPIFSEPRYILCPKDSPLPDRVLTHDDLNPYFEVAYLSQNGSGQIEKWRRAHFPKDAKPYFEVSNLASTHNYLTDPRCWAIVPASIAMEDVSLQPHKYSYRELDADLPPRVCHLLIAKAYSEDKIISELLKCCEEYIEERPYLRKIPWGNYWEN